ncbi:MAG: FAD-dependent oxidoreductase [Desulfobacterales bacterium]|nr:FAD-dependent oxidoreductase [Desulfobacterales bacterium]
MPDACFPHLFKEGQIGDVIIKNRIAMLPMARQFQGFNGEVTQKTIDYYAERAKGGVGLIILGSTRVFPPGHKFFTAASLNIGDDRYIPGHCDLAQALHAHGAKVSIQFGHIGGQTVFPSVAASNVQQYFCDGTPYCIPRPITRGEIYDTVELFGAGAVRARTAGYDMVEIHAAHGYLFGGFLSPKLNLRTDEFGGSLENRTRIIVETIKEIKRAAGADFPVCVRISADDFVEDGIDAAESPKVAKMLETAGADVISVSAGSHETQHLSNDIMRLEEDFKRPLFEAIKKEVDIPIIVGGGYRNPDKAEKIVADGVADFLGMARSFLADAKWAQKAREGRVEDIRRCVSCGECLYKRGGKFTWPQGCSVNPVFAREREWSAIKPAAVKRKVMVIGGGPAGMEAARIASLRGHDVSLYDRGEELGGQLLLAAAPPGKRRLLWIREYLAARLEKQGVAVHPGVDVTPELIQREKPDAVVLAAGAAPARADYIDSSDERVVTAWDVLGGQVDVEGRKVVIIGGNMLGCEVAEFMTEKGNLTSVIKMRPGGAMAENLEPTNRRGLLDCLEECRVNFITDYKVEGLSSEGVRVVQRDTGEEQILEAETIVLALGAKPERTLLETLKEKGIAFHPIGDCQKPRNIREAIYEGHLIGRQV